MFAVAYNSEYKLVGFYDGVGLTYYPGFARLYKTERGAKKALKRMQESYGNKGRAMDCYITEFKWKLGDGAVTWK